MILAIRTDTAEATVALYNESKLVDQATWTAGRKLSSKLLQKIEELLAKNKTGWPDLTGIIVFKGPGSFTGLRIGITVANTVAYALNIPIVAAVSEDWINSGRRELLNTKPGSIVLPEYGAEANITKPKK